MLPIAVVDPYIERELLLVLMDTLLHRKNAFRHLLFHRRLLDPNHYAAETIQSALALAFCAIVMDAYIKYDKALTIDGVDRNNDSGGDPSVGSDGNGNALPELILLSCIEYIAMLLGCIAAAQVYCAYLSLCQKNVDDNRLPASIFMYHRQFTNFFLAINMPVIFLNSITIFFLIWENTVTIRVLSYLFALSFQRLALQVVLERAFVLEERRSYESEEHNIKSLSHMRKGCANNALIASILVLVVGLCARATSLNRFCADLFSHRLHYGIELFVILKEESTWRYVPSIVVD